jgi:hypothetical protein
MMMGMSLKLGAAALALAVISPGGAAWAEAPGDAAAPAAAVDPAAIKALQAMGAYLRTLKSFELHGATTLRQKAEGADLTVTLGFQTLYRVQRPDHFVLTLTSDKQVRQCYYDGKTITVNVPADQHYATMAAPATISATLKAIRGDDDIRMPLPDILQWSDDGFPIDKIQSASRVGTERIGTIDTDHYDFSGPLFDWKIWIARGPRPLPIRMVVTSRDDPTTPGYSAELSWNTAPAFDAKTFVFTPAPGASAVDMSALSQSGQ